MQNLAQDEAGNVWEIDPQGNPVRMVTPASPAQGRVFSLPQSAKEQRQEARQAAADARAEASAARSATNEERRLALAEQAAERAERAAQLAEGGTAKMRAEWRGNLNNIGQLEQTIASLRKQYDDNFKGKGLQSFAESYAPVGLAPQYGVFDDTAQSMLADMAKAKGLTAQQFNTPAEQRMFFEPLIPKRGDADEQIEAKLSNLERMIASGRATTEDHLNMIGQKADTEVPDPTVDADVKDTPDLDENGDPPPNSLRKSVASGDSRTTFDARTSSQVDAMLNAGASDAMINAVLKKQGYPTVRAVDTAAARKWMRENPGKRYYGANISRTDELNLLQKAAGSDTGAFLAHMANTATAGIPAALAGPEGQGALDAMAANSPGAAGFGGLAGGVTGALGAEAAIAGRAPAALAKYAPRIADTLYGGLLGFNQAREGEGAMGAVTGAGAGLFGGFLGEKAMGGVGRAVKGVSDPAVQYLRSRDIPLTVGQVMGGATKKIEDSLTSIPFVGNVVDARRMEGLKDFNRAAFDTAAEQVAGNSVTETGAEGVQQLRGIVGNAYDTALNPARIDPTEGQFGAELMQAINAAEAVPDVNGAQLAAVTGLDSRITGAIDPNTGDIPGRNFQEAYRGLARTGRERAGGDYGQEVGNVMRQGQDVLSGALERQNPGAFDAFRAANSTNRNVNVLAEAVNRAKSAESELFTPAQLNMADAQSARRLTGPLASAAGERPFYDLATAGQAILPSKLPDSGTATRALTGMALGGGVGAAGGYVAGDTETGTGAGLGTMLALAVGGSRPAQQLLTKALADRPDWAARFGKLLLENAGYGGAAGAGASASLLTSP